MFGKDCKNHIIETELASYIAAMLKEIPHNKFGKDCKNYISDTELATYLAPMLKENTFITSLVRTVKSYH